MSSVPNVVKFPQSRRVFRPDTVMPAFGLCVFASNGNLIVIPGWHRFAFAIRVRDRAAAPKLYDALERRRNR